MTARVLSGLLLLEEVALPFATTVEPCFSSWTSSFANNRAELLRPGLRTERWLILSRGGEAADSDDKVAAFSGLALAGFRFAVVFLGMLTRKR